MISKNKNTPLLKEDWEELSERLNESLPESIIELLNKAKENEKWPVAQLISIFERNTVDSFVRRHQISTYLKTRPDEFPKEALILGITGTPGAGKSSLIGALCKKLLEQNPDLSIAVLAIDPSSQDSGGALLGDRTRTQFPVNDKRLFFRSQASHLDLGGMGKSTFHVTRILKKLFDIIIVETVGIGQSEIEVQRLSDQTCLVMQPLAGDQVQFMKAGIMEVPDTFIINKCDEESLAKKSYQLLKASLKLAQIYIDQDSGPKKHIFMTSAIRNRGIDELSEHVLVLLEDKASQDQHDVDEKRESYFLSKWIKQAYGEFGFGVQHYFETQDDANKFNDKSFKSFEQKELAFKRLIANFVKHVH